MSNHTILEWFQNKNKSNIPKREKTTLKICNKENYILYNIIQRWFFLSEDLRQLTNYVFKPFFIVKKSTFEKRQFLQVVLFQERGQIVQACSWTLVILSQKSQVFPKFFKQKLKFVQPGRTFLQASIFSLSRFFLNQNMKSICSFWTRVF